MHMHSIFGGCAVVLGAAHEQRGAMTAPEGVSDSDKFGL